MMKVKDNWPALLALFCGLLLAASLRAQPASTPTPVAEEPEAATNTQASASQAQPNPNAPHRIDRRVIVAFGHDVELKSNETAEVVVVIGGTAKIHGPVRETVVAIGGDVEVDSEVGDVVVAVLGGIKVGPHADLQRDVVAVGGGIDRAEGASIHGESVDLSARGFPNLIWLREWFLHCALWLRPLAPQVGWAWALAGVIALFYLLVAALFPAPVQACVQEINRRPATTFFLGLLTKFLVPLLFGLLTVTGFGALVVPFLFAALMVGAIVGKIALMEWLGLRIGNQFELSALQKPLVGFVLGLAIILLLYNIPVLGLLTFVVMGIWGLGSAVTAALVGLRREMPARPVAPANPPPTYAAPAMAPAYAGGVGGGSGPSGVVPPAGATADFAAATTAGPSAPPPTLPPGPGPLPMPEALAYPRAGFWERMGAGFLDLVLVGILARFVGGMPLGLLVALAYFAGMWTWKGTTVGGIVLGLKVVRLDDQPVTFVIALVRGLAAAFSMVVFFLGFLWIIWDRERQSWHDRIAGTVVIRLPRGASLVCI